MEQYPECRPSDGSPILWHKIHSRVLNNIMAVLSPLKFRHWWDCLKRKSLESPVEEWNSPVLLPGFGLPIFTIRSGSAALPTEITGDITDGISMPGLGYGLPNLQTLIPGTSEKAPAKRGQALFGSYRGELMG